MITSLRAAILAISMSFLTVNTSSAGDTPEVSKEDKTKENKSKEDKTKEDKTNKGDCGPFEGKVLVISTNLLNNTGAILEKVTIEDIGGKKFLRGDVPKELEKTTWKQSTPFPVYISVEHITQIVQYSSAPQAIIALGLCSKP